MLVYGEVVEHLASQQNADYYAQALLDLLEEVTPHSLTTTVMDRYALLRRQLRRPYGPGLIGDVDILIAATAMEHDLALVTTDRDFERVPGLRLMLLDRRTLTQIGGEASTA